MPEPNSGCVLYLRRHHVFGYGLVSTGGGGSMFAHRAAWEIERGPVPAGRFVSHKCFVPCCINVNHLFLSSQQENAVRAKRKQTLAERMEAASIPEPNSGCFLWLGYVEREGYGKVWHDGRMRKAHRLAWELANGPVSAGLFVCHRCDNRACVNPDHLFLGDHQDNVDDMMRKGRKRTGVSIGRVLSDEDVSVIRLPLRSTTTQQLADRFGVSRGHIRNLRVRRPQHVEGA